MKRLAVPVVAALCVLTTLVPLVQIGLLFRSLDRVRSSTRHIWCGREGEDKKVPAAVLAACRAEGFDFEGTTFEIQYKGSWRRASVKINKRVQILGVVPVVFGFDLVAECEQF
ncbi:MAG: hypothetical protein JNK60_03915 [Acidobacteria bacterium]|nr:hypothetical protein [Acidobacteriota bacterium]